MSLQHSAVRLPEGGDDWQLAGQEGQEQVIDQTQTTEDVGAQEQAPEVIDQTPQLSDLERVALGLGWTPKGDWRGDPNKWTDAASYITQTGRVLDRTKNDLKATRRMADEMNARLARVEQGQTAFQNERAETIRQEYEDAKFEAAKAGDRELWAKLDKEQNDVLSKVRPAPRQAPQASEGDVYAQAEAIMSDPVAARFFEANPIALQDEQAWAIMDREMTLVAQRGGTPTQQFRAAEEALRYAYAHQYERPAFNGQVPANGGQQHHSQQQVRDERGQFAQQTPQQQRRPAPPMNAGSRTSTPAADVSAVDRLPADAKAFLKTQMDAGKVKDADRWARTFLGEKVIVSGRAINSGARS